MSPATLCQHTEGDFKLSTEDGQSLAAIATEEEHSFERPASRDVEGQLLLEQIAA